MSEKYLERDSAPFGEKVWEQIDATVVEAAKSQLYARKLLAVEGPFGIGLKSISKRDEHIKGKNADDIDVMFSSSLPLTMLQKNFILGARDVAEFESENIIMDTGNAAEAALLCARKENDFILSGVKGYFSGLINTSGINIHKIKKWSEPGKAIDDIIQAVNTLDHSGIHGPYALALSPELYNGLFHRYQQGNTTEIEHLSQLVTQGIFKAAGLPVGGILTSRGKQFASILLGQDLMTGFVGPVSGGYEFSLSESFTLKVLVPEAFCLLKSE